MVVRRLWEDVNVLRLSFDYVRCTDDHYLFLIRLCYDSQQSCEAH